MENEIENPIENPAVRPDETTVVILSLAYQRFFKDMYGGLVGKIKANARCQWIKDPPSPVTFLSTGPPPTAVIITDEALTKLQHNWLWLKVGKYAHEGGTVIVMGHFPGFVDPLTFKRFFSVFEVPWEAGSCYRATHTLNPQVADSVGVPIADLPAQYSQKALLAKNVQPEHALYQMTQNPATGAHESDTHGAQNPPEVAVAAARVFSGRICYIGDLGGNPETNDVILPFCGL